MRQRGKPLLLSRASIRLQPREMSIDDDVGIRAKLMLFVLVGLTTGTSTRGPEGVSTNYTKNIEVGFSPGMVIVDSCIAACNAFARNKDPWKQFDWNPVPNPDSTVWNPCRISEQHWARHPVTEEWELSNRHSGVHTWEDHTLHQ